MFEGRFYWEAVGYTALDMLALIKERERRARTRLERAHLALRLDHEPRPRRVSLTKPLKLAVFNRDGGRCVECGSNFDLQYDHIIPLSMGGATSVENLQLLCSTCNQSKGGNL
jgi:5-methylcytosine-specific restriction endonuclease McrA